ncbi:MAG: sugar-binding domain-containing protein [Planctomycetia bacterium]|nr:sugar-binding domain-containing protein [Planctomycetia bacterium]
MSKVKTPRWHPGNEPDDFVFSVCERFLQDQGRAFQDSALSGGDPTQQRASTIAKWVQETLKRPDISRERIYPILWEGTKRGFLRLVPPLEKMLSDRLRTKFDLPESSEITVVNVSDNEASSHVASVAADKVLELIQQVAQAKQQASPETKPDDICVHLGMGAGYVSMLVATRLAKMISSGERCPALAIHAISAGGFFVKKPQRSPIAYFSYFEDGIHKHNIEYIAFFSETVLEADEYERVMKKPSLVNNFRRKDEIDIIVTSLAEAKHEHGLLRQYLYHLCDEDPRLKEQIQEMDKLGWIGDVQFRPYSADGPLTDCGTWRAVTLFELNELVNFVRPENRNKHVVLVGGPCGECGQLKTDALLPLLKNENLRVWNHLVTDASTANDLLKRQ